MVKFEVNEKKPAKFKNTFVCRVNFIKKNGEDFCHREIRIQESRYLELLNCLNHTQSCETESDLDKIKGLSSFISDYPVDYENNEIYDYDYNEIVWFDEKGEEYFANAKIEDVINPVSKDEIKNYIRAEGIEQTLKFYIKPENIVDPEIKVALEQFNNSFCKVLEVIR